MQMRGMFVNIKHRMDIHMRKNPYFLGAIVATFGIFIISRSIHPSLKSLSYEFRLEQLSGY